MATSTTEAAMNAIRKLIIEGSLPPGARLPAEPELASQMGLSRNMLREAVRALVQARVLDVRRGDGTYVTSLEPSVLLDGIGFAVELMQDDRILELIELRRVLEPAATALAAERISVPALAELGVRLAAMRDSHGESRVRQDFEFHAAIAAAAGNQTLSSMLSGVSSHTLHARIWHGRLDVDADRRAHDEHEAICAAIAERDPVLAHAAALQHVANTERWYRQMLDADATATATATAPVEHESRP